MKAERNNLLTTKSQLQDMQFIGPTDARVARFFVFTRPFTN